MKACILAYQVFKLWHLPPFYVLTHLWAIFLDLILPLRWFKSDVRGIFQNWLVFFNDMTFLPIFFKTLIIVHLPLWFIVVLLFVLVNFLFVFGASGGGIFSLSIGQFRDQFFLQSMLLIIVDFIFLVLTSTKLGVHIWALLNICLYF
jgi:hypothetical protein